MLFIWASGIKGRIQIEWAGIAYYVQRLATGWTMWGLNPVAGIFRTRPDRPWGAHSLPYNGYRDFTGGKAAGTRSALR